MASELYIITLTERYRYKDTNKKTDTNTYPFISVHIPTKNEEPSVVIETIKSCLNLDYPNYEIVVVSNNCTDESIWKPVEEFCRQHQKIKFVHFDYLPGFKAGALNCAIRLSDKSAEFVALVDADYIVKPAWLKASLPYFVDDEISAVQTPQHYRVHYHTFLEKILILENDLTFKGGNLNYRSTNNASVLHGTMCVLRKKDIDSVGLWSEESITEDAELGIRFLTKGKKVVSLFEVYGSGLVPYTLKSLLNQRSRWVYGATKVLLKYKRQFFNYDRHFNFTQKTLFVSGWMPWLTQLLYPLFIILIFSQLYIIAEQPRDIAPGILYTPLILLFITYLFKVVYYTKNAKLYSLKSLLFLVILYSSLIPTIMSAVYCALLGYKMRFKTTNSYETYNIAWYSSIGKHIIRVGLIGLFSYWLFYILQAQNLEEYVRHQSSALHNSDVVWLAVASLVLLLPLISYYLVMLFALHKTD
jgi:cellulose synthase/poly-beta-1,6-N-acetylglucosamine synthase-like glycosyltransferase